MQLKSILDYIKLMETAAAGTFFSALPLWLLWSINIRNALSKNSG